jgi:hypothetical protein
VHRWRDHHHAAREWILAWSVPYVTTTLSLVVNGAKTPAIGSTGGDDRLRRRARNAEARPDWRHKGLPFRPDRGGDDGSCCGRITAVMKVAPVAAWRAAKRPDLRGASSRRPPTTRDRIREGSGGASCCERRTRSDAAAREYGSTRGEVGRAVSDRQTREFVTYSL